MLSRMKWFPAGLTAALVLALLLGGSAWGGKPVKPPPEPPPLPSVEYQVTWLNLESAFGAPIEWLPRDYMDINDVGDVCGCLRAAGVLSAFLFTAETGSLPLDDFALPPEDYLPEQFHLSTANGINNQRQIVGRALLDGLGVAYCLSLVLDEHGKLILDANGAPVPAQVEILPMPAEANYMEASDINDLGDVVCTWEDINNSRYPVMFFGITREARNIPVEGAEGRWRINNERRLAGNHYVGNYPYPLRYNAVTGAIDILDVWYGKGWNINGEGRIVGWALLAHYDHGFVSQPTGTGVVDLGTIDASSFALDINDAGHIVGENRDRKGNIRPCLYLDEFGWIDLSLLIAPECQLAWDAWPRKRPSAINNGSVAGGFGQIVGVGQVTLSEEEYIYDYDVFLLTPVPTED